MHLKHQTKCLHKSATVGVYLSMKRNLILIAVLTVAVFVGSMVYISFSSRQTGHVDGVKILAATRTYTADLKGRGLTIPSTVSLQELINHHFLSASDVSGFNGMDVTVNLSADYSRPQDILIRARLTNGQEIVTLADGSVQQLSRSRARQIDGTNSSPASH